MTLRHRCELMLVGIVVAELIAGLVLGMFAVFVGFMLGMLASVAIVGWLNLPVPTPPDEVVPGDPRWCDACAGLCRDES